MRKRDPARAGEGVQPPGELGLHVALTGSRLGGAEAIRRASPTAVEVALAAIRLGSCEPRWSPARLEEVDPRQVAVAFGLSPA